MLQKYCFSMNMLVFSDKRMESDDNKKLPPPLLKTEVLYNLIAFVIYSAAETGVSSAGAAASVSVVLRLRERRVLAAFLGASFSMFSL